MEEKLKPLKCELCGKEHLLLIKIEVAGEGSWAFPKGICCKCFKGGDLEERIFLKNREHIKEQIQQADSGKKYWQQQLENLEKLTKKKP